MKAALILAGCGCALWVFCYWIVPSLWLSMLNDAEQERADLAADAHRYSGRTLR